MADVDIDPFGEHESRTEESTDEIFLQILLPQEDRLGNQHVNRKLHLEEENLKELN